VLNGTALYTGTFTPSTVPLTAITNTQLLTCQSNRFVDNSTNNATPTIINSPSVQGFSPFGPSTAYSTSVNGGSVYFDGNDYITPAVSSATTVGTSNFTIEFWVYPTASPTTNWNPIFSMGASGGGQEIRISQNINGTGYGYLIPNSANSADIFVGFGTLTLNAWHHIALVRNGSTVTFYRNGVVIGSTTSVGFNFTNTGTFYIGYGQYAGDGYFPGGYVSNFRLVKGTAVYTAAFTPPTAPLTAITNTSLLLSGTSAAIFDNAMLNDLETVGNTQVTTSQYKYGIGSMYFDGTGDALYSTSQAVTFGTGDFTIEFWVYFIVVNNGSPKYFYDMRNAGATSASFFAQEASSAWTYWNGAGTSISSGFTSSTFSATTWTYVTICRSSGVTKFFVNGTQTGSVADTSSYATSTLTIGSRYSYTEGSNFYIDDFRVTKGYARYTASFTPPTQAFPNA